MNIDLFIGFLFGLFIGAGITFFILRAIMAKSSAVEKLEEEHSQYREGVDAHFVKTAELFKDLTDQYRDVYQHMAQGADQLCSDEVKTIQSDLAKTGLLSQQVTEAEQEKESEQEIEVTDEVDDLDESKVDIAEKNEPEPTDDKKEDYPLASEVELPAEMLAKQEAKK